MHTKPVCHLGDTNKTQIEFVTKYIPPVSLKKLPGIKLIKHKKQYTFHKLYLYDKNFFNDLTTKTFSMNKSKKHAKPYKFNSQKPFSDNKSDLRTFKSKSISQTYSDIKETENLNNYDYRNINKIKYNKLINKNSKFANIYNKSPIVLTKTPEKLEINKKYLKAAQKNKEKVVEKSDFIEENVFDLKRSNESEISLNKMFYAPKVSIRSAESYSNDSTIAVDKSFPDFPKIKKAFPKTMVGKKIKALSYQYSSIQGWQQY